VKLTRQNFDSSGRRRGGRNYLFAAALPSIGIEREPTMLGWVVTFLIIGLIAAIFGFGGLAGASFAAAKIIFFIALILLLVSIVFGTMRRSP
jgi:uncharacterized membrane protein YtjA (UPF0391 family)